MTCSVHIFLLPLHPISKYQKNMLDLSQIFPINYPDVPTHEDIEFMFKEILNHSDSVNQVVREIEKETCPYYKESLIRRLADDLDYWYENQKSIAGIDHGDCWIPYWQEPKDKIRQLINRYQAEQKHFTYKPLQTSPVVPSDCPDLSAIPLSQPSTPTATKEIKGAINLATSAVQQVMQQLSAIKATATQPIVIQNMHFHFYNAPIGQCGNNTTITGLENLIQDNHGKINF